MRRLDPEKGWIHDPRDRVVHVAGDLVRVFEEHFGDDAAVPDANPWYAVECDMTYAPIDKRRSEAEGRLILQALGCSLRFTFPTRAEAIEWADAHAAHGCEGRVRHQEHID